ncbi:ligase-associated DNA damage response endonuclease PdeM [Stakelama marina]|uniref:Ligase-associated DNA damage response endonuclease PdeM n=1 Tax=Stakelama marina TaxID=2826939 RepID=A0A8T4IFS7_9SPHN|nr:ligase-associated DNA damage response endonuclease PdeM [Stakelama marina]MBR0553301.1 ligase-associated DNA damage response endonuclease PdeM [Stakelama marina]
MVPLSFAGRDFAARTDGTLFWPQRRALLVADLHFEKASWFARHGQMLPPYDSMATLRMLAAAVEAVDAREVWCLGDSFHDRAGSARMRAEARDALHDLTRSVRWTWISGNHDAVYEDRLGGDVVTEAEVDGLILRHQAEPAEARPELSGHFHPKIRVRARGRSVARRCFLASQSKLILPAFGSLTGGLDAAHPEIIRAIGRSAEALIALDDRLLRFRVAA